MMNDDDAVRAASCETWNSDNSVYETITANVNVQHRATWRAEHLL